MFYTRPLDIEYGDDFSEVLIMPKHGDFDTVSITDEYFKEVLMDAFDFEGIDGFIKGFSTVTTNAHILMLMHVFDYEFKLMLTDLLRAYQYKFIYKSNTNTEILTALHVDELYSKFLEDITRIVTDKGGDEKIILMDLDYDNQLELDQYKITELIYQALRNIH